MMRHGRTLVHSNQRQVSLAAAHSRTTNGLRVRQTHNRQRAKLKQLLLRQNQLEGSIPDEIGECVALEALQLRTNKLTGNLPASIGKCTRLQEVRLFENQLEGAVPASALAELTELTQLALYQNERLTITASGKAAIERAAPKGKFWWPAVIDG